MMPLCAAAARANTPGICPGHGVVIAENPSSTFQIDWGPCAPPARDDPALPGIDKLTFQTERKAVGSDVRLLPHFSKTQKLAV